MLHLNPIDGVTISYLHTDCCRAVRMEVAIEQLGDGMLIFIDLYDLSHKAVPYLVAGEVIHWRCESFLAKDT